MGEYAKRKSDGAHIKIGTCESMYYLRLEDKNKVTPDSGSDFGYYWRLPFPDEDGVLPGDYQDYNRGLRLYKTEKVNGSEYCKDYENEDFCNEYPGTIQLYHKEAGLLVNLPCHHGHKLPEGVNAHWNGKGYSLELAHIRTAPEGIFPIIRCRHCNHMWRTSWEDVWDYIPANMQSRLAKYREEAKAA